jgi:hypothetical protein
MPQYTDPTTGRKVQLPYGPGGGQGGGQGVLPGEWDWQKGPLGKLAGLDRDPGFVPIGQGQGSSLFPANSRLRMPGGQQTMGGAGTRQFPVNLNLPAGTQTTAPQSPTDRSLSLNNLAGQYGSIPSSLEMMPGVSVERPDVYLPQLPGGGVGPPTSTSTGQPLGAPPNTTWNTEGRWAQQPIEEPPPVVLPDLPDIPGDFPQYPEDPGPYDPRTPGPTTQPQLSGINDLLESIQTRDAAREARQAPYFNMLSQRLGELSQPVTGEGREADAIRLANQRAAERQQSDLAARMAGAGLGDSGAMDSGLENS